MKNESNPYEDKFLVQYINRSQFPKKSQIFLQLSNINSLFIYSQIILKLENLSFRWVYMRMIHGNVFHATRTHARTHTRKMIIQAKLGLPTRSRGKNPGNRMFLECLDLFWNEGSVSRANVEGRGGEVKLKLPLTGRGIFF